MTLLASGDADRPTARGLVAEVAVVFVALCAAILVLAWRPDADRLVVAATIAVAALVAWIAWHDARTLTIPDGAVLALAIVALAARWSLSDDGVARTATALLVDGGLPGGMLLLFREIHYRRRGVDGLGLGDVKLAAAGGLLVGVEGFAWALLSASVLALCAVGILRLARGRAPDRLAFGAVLAPAILAVWIALRLPLLLAVAGG